MEINDQQVENFVLNWCETSTYCAVRPKESAFKFKLLSPNTKLYPCNHLLKISICLQNFGPVIKEIVNNLKLKFKSQTKIVFVALTWSDLHRNHHSLRKKVCFSKWLSMYYVCVLFHWVNNIISSSFVKNKASLFLHIDNFIMFQQFWHQQ